MGAAPGRGRPARRLPRGATMTEPIEILYFYRTRWGAHDEFVELFDRNHWPILREQLAAGRYTDVRDVDAAVPRRGPRGLGRAGLDHVPRLGGDPGAQRRGDRRSGCTRTRTRSSARSSTGSRCSRRTGTSCSRIARSIADAAGPASRRDRDDAPARRGSRGMAARTRSGSRGGFVHVPVRGPCGPVSPAGVRGRLDRAARTRSRPSSAAR